MRLARWVYLIAGVWGIVAVLPLYFLEAKTGEYDPPAVTHPEYYYGFVGVTLAWQVLFLVIATDPARYRPAMIATVLEKASFVVAVGLLYAAARVPAALLGFAAVDGTLLVLFLVAFWRTGRP